VRDSIDERLADLALHFATQADRDFRLVRRDADHLVIDGGRGGRIELHSASGLRDYLRERGLGPGPTRVVMESTEMSPWDGVAVARDARILSVTALDPRAHAVLTHATEMTERAGDRAELLRRRANLMGWVVRERMGLRFEPVQAAAFPELCDEDDREPEAIWPRM
ncbi:hypothetical protein WDZ92_34185, partial [Nostoc sp. NIES-2111]